MDSLKLVTGRGILATLTATWPKGRRVYYLKDGTPSLRNASD